MKDVMIYVKTAGDAPEAAILGIGVIEICWGFRNTWRGDPTRYETLRDALVGLSYWLKARGTPRVFSNGGDFDCLRLREAYTRLGLDTPWPDMTAAARAAAGVKVERDPVDPREPALATAGRQATAMMSVRQQLKGAAS